MDNAISIKDFEINPSIVTELFSHCGGGYNKRLYVDVNVITKEVCYEVVDKKRGIRSVFGGLPSAIDAYNNILWQHN